MRNNKRDKGERIKCSFCDKKATLVPAMFMGIPTGEIYKLEPPMILIPDDPKSPRPDREFLLNSFGRCLVACNKDRNKLKRWIKTAQETANRYPWWILQRDIEREERLNRLVSNSDLKER